MGSYAVVIGAVVLNTVVLDFSDDWQPPENSTVVQITEETGAAGPGWTWDGKAFHGEGHIVVAE